MDKNKVQRRGFFWNTLGSTMFGANSFIMLAMVSRIGTVEQTGYFGIAFTTAQILYIVALFGTPHYQMTDYGEKYSFSDYARVRVISSFVATIGCVCAIIFFQFTDEKALYTLILTILMLLNAAGELYQCLFFQKNRLDLSGSALFFRTFWSLLLFCGILIVTHNIIGALIVQITVNLGITTYYGVKIAPQFFPGENGNTASPGVRSLMQECLPLFISLLFINVVLNLSKYGVEFFMDDKAQGYYNMIFIPAQVINLCSQFLFKPFLKQYSQSLYNNQNRIFAILLVRQIFWVTALTGVCCTVAFCLGAPVLGLFYQRDLKNFIIPLTMIVFGGGIFALCQLFYYIFIILRRQIYILMIYLLAFILSIFPTFALVKRFGLTGAAISFATVHGLILLCYTGLLYFLLRGRSDA